MKFILITGPQAVGKMAVGKQLAKTTGLKLFHNHMTIEPVVKIFDYQTKEAKHLIQLFRREIFEAMARSDQPGLIFTFVWAFNFEADGLYVKELMELFESYGTTTYIVELESDLETRLLRNKTELRLQEKPTKRNITWSENELITSMHSYRMNSLPGEVNHPHYLKINNTNLTVEKTVEVITEFFSLKADVNTDGVQELLERR